MWERAYNRHVKSVMKSGQPARAEVISAEMAHFSGISTGDVSYRWNLSLHVIPEQEGAAPFDLTLKKMEVPVLVTPMPGMTLQVIYDPNKPESMIVDPASVPRDEQEREAIDAANMTREMGFLVDSAPAPAEPPADPVAEARAKIEALTHGAPPDQAALGEALRALRDVVADGAATPPPTQATPPSELAAVVQAQIAKLDALRSSGVLDEQTYNASKQRLLDGLSQAG
jgi:hypothetical protein